jgi:hypothetical protein
MLKQLFLWVVVVFCCCCYYCCCCPPPPLTACCWAVRRNMRARGPTKKKGWLVESRWLLRCDDS